LAAARLRLCSLRIYFVFGDAWALYGVKTACCPQRGLRSWPPAAAGPSLLAIFAAASSVVIHLVRLRPLEDEETFVHCLLPHGSSHPGPTPGVYSTAVINSIPAAVLRTGASSVAIFRRLPSLAGGVAFTIFSACLNWPASTAHRPRLVHFRSRTPQCVPAELVSYQPAFGQPVYTTPTLSCPLQPPGHHWRPGIGPLHLRSANT